MSEKMNEIQQRRARLLPGGLPRDIEKQHSSGKLTARERMEKLFDRGTFQEVNLWISPIKTGFDIDTRELPGDAVITGVGKVKGRQVCAYAHDFTVAGGTFGSAFHHKVARLMEMALNERVPCVQIVDSGGERIHDWFGRPAHRPILGGKSVAGSPMMYEYPGIMTGVVPQITLMLGPMYAGAAYIPTMADFMIMTNKTAFMSVASPALLKAVTHADVTQEEIGGAVLHATTTGTADFLTESDEESIEICRYLLSYIPSSCDAKAPEVDSGDDPLRSEEKLLDIAHNNYDMHEVIGSVVDRGQFLEIQKLYARSLIIGFTRLNGKSVGIVANNPAADGGILTLNTCDKEARFVRFCDAFNIPVIFLADTPGFQSDTRQEQSMDGLIRTVPKPVFAICEATVPLVTVYLGKCFGLSRMVMGMPRMGVDYTLCWPSSQVAQIAPEAARAALKKEEVKENPGLSDDKYAELINGYFNFPYHAPEKAMADDIIDPKDTRKTLINLLDTLTNKKAYPRPRRKHSLLPQ
ncbi:MAG: carboxyl transferase domain-containing protein [Dehalococcoidales bacterium]|nr:carboxyl transferase domain-containing protein [Dehalococcoidales bacterium]